MHLRVVGNGIHKTLQLFLGICTSNWYPTGNFPLIPLHQDGNLLVRFGHLSWVSGIPEMSIGHPGTKQKLRCGHPLTKYHLLVWPCVVVYTENSVAWTKIHIKWPKPAGITHWRHVTTTESHWESSYRARPPPCWDALNSSFWHL